jgi:hypothetical protein
MVDAYLGRVRAQAAKRWEAGEREPLFLENAAPPTPAPGFAEGRWSPPPEPFAAAPDGLTAIEHALHALSVERGGAAFGNLGRPLHAPGGGLLTVAPDGAVLWRPGGRDGGAVEATVTFADGGRTRLVLGAA